MLLGLVPAQPLGCQLNATDRCSSLNSLFLSSLTNLQVLPLLGWSQFTPSLQARSRCAGSEYPAINATVYHLFPDGW